MPRFAKCMNDSLFYWPSTGSTNWYPHFVMTAQAIELLIFLPSIFFQFNPKQRTSNYVMLRAKTIIHSKSNALHPMII